MVNAADQIANVWPFLAVTAGQPLFWTAEELYTYVDRAVQALCLKTGLIVLPEESVVYFSAQETVSLPSRTIRVIAAANLISNLQLALRTTSEMNALSESWRSDTGEPQALVVDAAGMLEVRVWPTPSTPGATEVAVIVGAETVSALAPNIEIPDALRPLIRLSALAGAREKEGKAALPEVAKICRQIAQMIEETAAYYWRPTA